MFWDEIFLSSITIWVYNTITIDWLTQRLCGLGYTRIRINHIRKFAWSACSCKGTSNREALAEKQLRDSNTQPLDLKYSSWCANYFGYLPSQNHPNVQTNHMRTILINSSLQLYQVSNVCFLWTFVKSSVPREKISSRPGSILRTSYKWIIDVCVEMGSVLNS